jgi:hypothetical protein
MPHGCIAYIFEWRFVLRALQKGALRLSIETRSKSLGKYVRIRREEYAHVILMISKLRYLSLGSTFRRMFGNQLQ